MIDKQRDTVGSDELLIAALAAGDRVADAAAKAGMSEPTAHRRLSSLEFRQRVSDARRQTLDRAISILAKASTAAAIKLCKLLEAGSEHVQFRAAVAIIELGTKLREKEHLEQMLEELIARLGDQP